MNPQALYWLNGTWQSLEVENAENLDNLDSTDFSLVNHKHFKSDITDLPGNATTAQDGFMSAADKTKLNNIANNANNYTHPSSHAASMITQDATHRFVTDTEKSTWNAKASTSVATVSTNGLMSATDKAKLDGISSGAGNYEHPTSDGYKHVPANGTTNNGKYLQATATAGTYQWSTLPSASTTTAGIVQLNDTVTSTSTTLAATANAVKTAYDKANHTHPYAATSHTHTKSQISDFPTSLPANGGNAATVNGKTVESNVPANAVFTDTTYGVATTSANGLMSTTMVTKLNGIATNANNYVHPTTSGNKHIPSGGSSGQYLKWSSAGTAVWATLEGGGGGASNLKDGPSEGSIMGSFEADGFTFTPGIYSISFGQYAAAFGEGGIAMGNGVMANGTNSHAIGKGTTAYGANSHAEGQGSAALGDNSHAEGYYATANESYAHAEGYSTQANGIGSHAEGYKTIASGDYCHAEGEETQAKVGRSHAEGYKTIASSSNAHAEGSSTTASGVSAHAEGSNTTASGWYSHAEGYKTQALKDYSHAEGQSTIANYINAHAEGYNTKAYGTAAHSEGSSTTASGASSHSEGVTTSATGDHSHVEGYFTTAETCTIHVQGRYNKVNSGSGTTHAATHNAFVIGNGTSASALSNAFRVTYDGKTYGLSAFNSTGADYAEYFEWLDGNPNNEDRIGYFVTLENSKIKIANSADDYIVGIISGNQSIIGNACEDSWNDMYIRDEFDRLQYEDIEVEIEDYIQNEETKEMETITKKVVEKHIKLNPNYDSNVEYIPRSKRQEWGIVGMLGQIKVRDDGTCKVNSYCKPSEGGIATHSDDRSHYRVIERINDHLIKVVFK